MPVEIHITGTNTNDSTHSQIRSGRNEAATIRVDTAGNINRCSRMQSDRCCPSTLGFQKTADFDLTAGSGDVDTPGRCTNVIIAAGRQAITGRREGIHCQVMV